MTLTTVSYGKKSIGGSVPHYVKREDGETIGVISEVFPDVFYVKPYGPLLYKDNTRYRRFSDALASPVWSDVG